jgi:hypothetical protein
MDILTFLKERHGAVSLWNAKTEYEDEANEDTLPSILVTYACHQIVNQDVVKSIELLLLDHFLEGTAEYSLIQHIERNRTGNHLHHAAARGHKELLNVLLECGMNQAVPCKYRAIYGWDTPKEMRTRAYLNTPCQ